MRHPTPNPHRSAPRRGTVAALVALLLPVVVGVMALSLDGGLLYLQRRQAQSTADAAALAGAYQLFNGSNFSVAQAAAIAMGSRNGYTIPSTSVTSPQTGYISVTVAANRPDTAAAFGERDRVGHGRRRRSGEQPGQRSRHHRARDVGSTSVTAHGQGRGLYQRRLERGRFQRYQSGHAHVRWVGVRLGVDITGGYSTSGSGQFVTSPTANNIKTGVSRTPDPLGAPPAPAPRTTLTAQTYTNQTTLQPGYYASGINIAAPSGTITLQPGVYYTNGGVGDTALPTSGATG